MGVKLAAPRKASHRGRRGATPMSDINVTPMVDVMLVLLIIFMVTAPLLTAGVPVDLPQTNAQQISDPQEPLVVSINRSGKVFLQETELDPAQLAARIQAITQNKPDTKIFIRADKGIDYGTVMNVMGELTGAGFSQISLIVQSPEGALKK
ncbi:MAG TPA: protein TolR [Dongiaceae bacterium]|jgi:biopolymer transport protein TolR|nr:protein TolR [Dongiaceae bacterium]